MIGFVSGIIPVLFEYRRLRALAKSAEVFSGTIPIRNKQNRRTQYFVFIAYMILYGSLVYISQAVHSSSFAFSFIIGVLSSIAILMFPVGLLLEAEFGKIYILMR